MLQVKHPSSYLTANWTMSVLVAAAAKVSGEVPKCSNLRQCQCLYHCRHDGWSGIVESRYYRTCWVEVGADVNLCAGEQREYRILLRDCPLAPVRLTALASRRGGVTHVALECLKDERWCEVDCSYIDFEALRCIVAAILAEDL